MPLYLYLKNTPGMLWRIANRTQKVHTDTLVLSTLTCTANIILDSIISLLNVLWLPTCASGTGPMAGLTSPSVAVVISPWVTGHLTLVSLKTGKKTETNTHWWLWCKYQKIYLSKKLLWFHLISNKKHREQHRWVKEKLGFFLGKDVGRGRKKNNVNTGNLVSCVGITTATALR